MKARKSAILLSILLFVVFRTNVYAGSVSENGKVQSKPEIVEQGTVSVEDEAAKQGTVSMEDEAAEQGIVSIEDKAVEQETISIDNILQDIGTYRHSEQETAPSVISEMKLRFKELDSEKRIIYLYWSEVKNAAHYQIMQYINGKWEVLGETDSLSREIRLADTEKVFRYKVQAYSGWWDCVGKSNTIKVGVPVVSSLQTTGYSKTKVKLLFGKSFIASEYQVYRKTTNGTYHKLKTIKDNSLADTVSFGKNYVYKVVPVFQTEYGIVRGSDSVISYRNQVFVSMDHQKYTYEEMIENMYAMKEKYNEYVQIDIIGYSTNGRAVYDFIIGNPDAEKNMLVVSALHAREYVTTVICMKQAEYYLLNYNQKIDGKYPSKVFHDVKVHYIMMSNPDGVHISQTTNSQWKANSKGVNLNRNFPYAFVKSGSIAGNDYSGNYGGSELETQVLMSITKKLKQQNLVGIINYHAMGNIVFGEYHGNSNIKNIITSMYQTARAATGYSDARGYSGTSNGNYREYVMYGLDIPCITIEVGSTACPVALWQYQSIYNTNKFVILREAALFQS